MIQLGPDTEFLQSALTSTGWHGQKAVSLKRSRAYPNHAPLSTIPWWNFAFSVYYPLHCHLEKGMIVFNVLIFCG